MKWKLAMRIYILSDHFTKIMIIIHHLMEYLLNLRPNLDKQ